MRECNGWVWVPIAAALLAPGCVDTPVAFDSPDPARRLDAAVQAAGRGDEDAIPDLIEMLDSDDPATRLVAIRSLERLTDQTLGYDHADPERQRRTAVDRWVGWYDSRRSGNASAEPAP